MLWGSSLSNFWERISSFLLLLVRVNLSEKNGLSRILIGSSTWCDNVTTLLNVS